MRNILSFSRRQYTGLLIILGTSTLGGATLRYLKTKDDPNAPPIHPHSFTPFTLLSRRKVSSTSSILTLCNTNGIADGSALKDVWKKSVWSVEVKQPQLQIARAYTPLPPPTEDIEEEYKEGWEFRFLVRREQGGEVSTYLHKLPEQSSIELRGPKIEYTIPEDVKEVVFLAGGTGIAPAMQVAYALQDRPGSRMHILWANRRREECEGGSSGPASTPASGWFSGWRGLFKSEEPMITQSSSETSKAGVIVQELEVLQRKAREDAQSLLNIDYYVDEEKTYIRSAAVMKLLESPLKDRDHSKVILISGPDGFIEYWAGKKIWTAAGEEQGPLGGVLGRHDLKGWSVWKL